MIGIAPSLVKFPADDKRYVCFLNRVDPNNKCYKIYDIQDGQYCRMFSHMNQDDDSADFSNDARWLCKVEDDELQFKYVQLPDEMNLRKTM